MRSHKPADLKNTIAPSEPFALINVEVGVPISCQHSKSSCPIMLMCWRVIVYVHHTKDSHAICDRTNGTTRQNFQLNPALFSGNRQQQSDANNAIANMCMDDEL